jgi:hypothetical protein
MREVAGMVSRLVDGSPLRVVGDLLVLDRWRAARAAPQRWRPQWNSVNAIERAVASLMANPATAPVFGSVLQVESVADPANLIGSGGDPDVLRSGSPLEVSLGSEDAQIRLEVSFPGLVALLLDERRDDYGFGGLGGLDVTLAATPLRPAEGRGSIGLRWVARRDRPVLQLSLEFDATGQVELTSPAVIDWKRMGLRVELVPTVVDERLLWQHSVRVLLQPGGPLEEEITTRVGAGISDLLDAWAPVLMGALMALPLRPVADGPALAALAVESVEQLAARLVSNHYPPGSATDAAYLAETLEHAALLPTNPFRAVALSLSDGLVTDVFGARLADHYVRHVAEPRLVEERAGLGARFEVEPIPDDSGGMRPMGTEEYGGWAPTPDGSDVTPRGACVVLRERYRVTLDHLVIPQRSLARMPLGLSTWSVTWRVSVRHRRLAGGSWTTLARRTTTLVLVDGRLVTLQPPAVVTAWLEVGGDVRVTGELRAGTTSICWFDVATALSHHGPLNLSQAVPVGLLDERPGASPPSGLDGADRASALVRVEQQSSLRASMLDWVGVSVRGVRLLRPVEAVQPVGPTVPLYVVLTVGGRVVARERLTPTQCADVRGGLPVDLTLPSADLYLRPSLPDPAVDLRVSLTGSDGVTDVPLAAADLSVRRDDPAHPRLRWGVPPGVAHATLLAASPMVEARLRLTHRHHDPDALPVEALVRVIDVHLHDVAIVRPTEPTAANLASLHLVAELVTRLDGVELSRHGPTELGPFTTETSSATADDPVVIPWVSLTGVGGAEPCRVAVPDGTEITVTVRGSERAAWLPEQHLGTSTITWTVHDTDPVDDDPPMQPTKQVWQQSGLSDPGGYFRFRVSAVGPPPPRPRFDPHDVAEALGSGPMGTTRTGGSVLSFTYASPPWAGELVVERRYDMVQDSPWQALPTPSLTVGVTATAALTLPTSGRWCYRLRSSNAAGSTASGTLVVTIAS